MTFVHCMYDIVNYSILVAPPPLSRPFFLLSIHVSTNPVINYKYIYVHMYFWTGRVQNFKKGKFGKLS